MWYVRQTSQNGRLLEWKPTLPTIHDPSVRTHKSAKQSPPSHKRHPNLTMTHKTNYAAPALWGNSRREGVISRRPPTTYTDDTTVECSGTPTEDWLRQQSIASIKRPPAEKEQKTTFTQDEDYRGDYQSHTNPLSQPTTNTKELSVTTQTDNNENTPTTTFRHKRLKNVLTPPPRYLSSITTSPPRSTQSKST